MSKPLTRSFSFASVHLKKSFSNGAVTEETKDVLLCDGKIHLNLVQQLFDLPVIEMKHGRFFLFLVSGST